VKQPTYENFEEFASIEEKLRIQVFEEMLRTKNISQQPRSRKNNYTRMTIEQKKRVQVFQIWSRKCKKKNKYYVTTKKEKVKQNRDTMKNIWSNKPRKKLHHYLLAKKVKIKLSCHLLFVSLAETYPSRHVTCIIFVMLCCSKSNFSIKGGCWNNVEIRSSRMVLKWNIVNALFLGSFTRA
jgi:hypothetical protein